MDNPPVICAISNCKGCLADSVGFDKALSGFDQYFPANWSVFPLVFCTEHSYSLETALINI